MKVEELEKMESRIERFNDAKAAAFRYEKIQRTLDSIPGTEHNIGTIIIDVQRSEFRYSAAEEKRSGAWICSMTKTDQEEFFGEFILWARGKISEKMKQCQQIMDEA